MQFYEKKKKNPVNMKKGEVPSVRGGTRRKKEKNNGGEEQRERRGRKEGYACASKLFRKEWGGFICFF